MQKQQTFYLFVFLSLLTHTSVNAGEADQTQQNALNKKFFEVATSKEITSQKKYETLKSLLDQKADVTTMGYSRHLSEKCTALHSIMFRMAYDKVDESDSIKLLIDSKCSLKAHYDNIGPLRKAIEYPHMHHLVSMFVQAKVDVALLPTQKYTTSGTYLHAISLYDQCAHSRPPMCPTASDYNSYMVTVDKEACALFETLKALGNVPVDTPNHAGTPPIHYSRKKEKPNLARLLLGHGANPYCPVDDCNCYKKDDEETTAIHTAWKTEADNQVLQKIPVRDLKNIVIDYCFWNPRNKKT